MPVQFGPINMSTRKAHQNFRPVDGWWTPSLQKLRRAAALGALLALVMALLPSAPAGASPATSDMRSHVLVFGGTGRLGSEIVERLDPEEFEITVFARSSSSRDRLKGLQINYAIGDLLDQESVVAALRGQQFDYVIDASARRNYPGRFYEIAMQNILAGLRDSEVEQFILHGSIGAGDSAAVFSGAIYARMRGIMADKTAAEQLLERSGMPYTIIRNGAIKVFETPATGTARLTENTGRMGTITRPDLAVLTMQCLGESTCLNITFHAVDPSWDDE